MQTVHEIHHYLEIQTHVIYAVRIRRIGTAYISIIFVRQGHEKGVAA